MFFHAFRIRRPRHPLARLLGGVLGLVAVLMLVALGLFAFAALAIGGVLFLLVNALRARSAPAHTPAGGAAAPAGVIEGEFTVVREPADPAARR